MANLKLRPVEYRIPDRLREPSVFEIFEGGERLLKRVLVGLVSHGHGEEALAQDIKGFLSLAEKGRPELTRVRKLVDQDAFAKQTIAQRRRSG